MKITLKHIEKRFSSSFAISDFNMEIHDGNFTTFLGPSGCGKTTILRMIAGLETPDAGEIFYDDICIFSDSKKINIPPEKRNLGFVFQDFALWPHMTVFENVAFPLRAKKQTKNLNEQVLKALKIVHLDGFENRLPKQLSGGQQQRVAFARAIVGKPDCVLFDEPLSALDAILREEMRIEMKRITKDIGATAIFVTHDQLEAMSMSDEIIIMNKGCIEQTGEPEEIYHQPTSEFVAKFIGKSNWLDEHSMVRPEAISFDKIDNGLEIKARVSSVQFLGSTYELCLQGEGFQWIVQSKQKPQKEENIFLYIDRQHVVDFDKKCKAL